MAHKVVFLAGAATALPLTAQTAPAANDERAVERATDAFGIRIGIEQIGLYSETQVRGFNLQDSGNYRVNGSYFVKSGGLIDTVLAGVVTQVGYNALEANFAAPSGIVEYRLRSPFNAPRLQAEASLREYGGRFYDLRGAATSGDGELAGLAGAQILLGKTSSGLSSNYYRFGAVSEWRPSDAARVTSFASLNLFDLEGFYGVSASGDTLPARIRHPRRYVASWSDHDGADLNFGLLGSMLGGEHVEISGSLFYSRLDLDHADFTRLLIDNAGSARAVASSNRPRVNQSWSTSLAASWRPTAGQRLYGELRGRRTRHRYAPAVFVDLGPVDLEAGLAPSSEPVLTPVVTTLDSLDQYAAALGYEGTLGRLRLKAGAQKTWHYRQIVAPGLDFAAARQSPWLYDASVAWAVTRDWTLFASATRGLEESGAAPDNAANRNDLLPPAIATQQEFGLRGAVTPGLTVIGSLFSIEKPAPGFDADNYFGLFGQLRHRGAELSLVGSATPRLRLVSGAVYLDAGRSGEPVRSGTWSREAVGLARFQAMAGITYSVPGIDGLSLDGQVNRWSSRLAASRGNLRTPPITTVDVGFRHGFDVGQTQLALRGRLTNLFDTDDWFSNRAEMLDRPNRRGVRLSLTANL